jgi:hypothetical protein
MIKSPATKATPGAPASSAAGAPRTIATKAAAAAFLRLGAK